MFKSVLTIIIAMFFITGCASPKKLENYYNEIGGKCIVIGKSMSAVEECIGVDFRESIYHDQIVKDHQTCKPSWGFPFVQSCGGIKVIYSRDNKVSKWLAWGQFDGV
jgi:hypothetical protein